MNKLIIIKNYMKKILIIIISLIVVGSGAFYGGIKYAENKASQGFIQNDFQRQQFSQGDIRGGFQGRVSGEARSNFLSGEILAKDEQSLTLKIPDGGSKIVFFSEATDITKSASGSSEDFKEGQQIIITGEENSDRSYIAQIIQIR